MENFQTSSEIHSINTVLKHDLRVTDANLTNYKKGVYYVGTESYCAVQFNIKILIHFKQCGNWL
jgi:hypothetical protein